MVDAIVFDCCCCDYVPHAVGKLEEDGDLIQDASRAQTPAFAFFVIPPDSNKSKSGFLIYELFQRNTFIRARHLLANKKYSC
jgi:hypothetical protein